MTLPSTFFAKIPNNLTTFNPFGCALLKHLANFTWQWVAKDIHEQIHEQSSSLFNNVSIQLDYYCVCSHLKEKRLFIMPLLNYTGSAAFIVYIGVGGELWNLFHSGGGLWDVRCIASVALTVGIAVRHCLETMHIFRRCKGFCLTLERIFSKAKWVDDLLSIFKLAKDCEIFSTLVVGCVT